MVDSRFRDVQEINYVMIAVARQKRRDAFELIRVPKAEEVLVKLSQLVCLRTDHCDVPKTYWCHPAVLEPRHGCIDVLIKLKHVAGDSLDFDERYEAGLAVRLGFRAQTEFAKSLYEGRNVDVRLELVAKA